MGEPLVDFMYLVYTHMLSGPTIGSSGLCCIPCLSSTIISLYLLVPFWNSL